MVMGMTVGPFLTYVNLLLVTKACLSHILSPLLRSDSSHPDNRELSWPIHCNTCARWLCLVQACVSCSWFAEVKSSVVISLTIITEQHWHFKPIPLPRGKLKFAMRLTKIILVLVLMVAQLAGLWSGVLLAAVPYDRFYPLAAPLVTLANRAELQNELNARGVIRLEGKDYCPGNILTGLTVSSNMRIYGLPGTICPKITISPGSTGIVISCVTADLYFPPSALLTTGNVFRRTTFGYGTITNAAVQGNMFLDQGWFSWNIDTTTQGYVKNNRFVRQVWQNVTPGVMWKAKSGASTASTGNVNLWSNWLTPPKAKYVITNVDEFTVINHDTESYDSDGTPAIGATGVGRLSVFSTTGAISDGASVDVGARKAWVHGNYLYNQASGGSNVIVRPENTSFVHTSFDDRRTVTFSGTGTNFQAMQKASDLVPVGYFKLDGVANPGSTNATQTANILDVVARNPAPVAWENPTYRDPPSLSSNLPRSAMDRAQIQALINSQGIVFLDPGVYTLDGPLLLGKNKMLLGSGMDQTFLVAANVGVDLIADDGSGRLAMADLTLQGGRHGIYHTYTSGPKMQFTQSVLSHVCIRDMSGSGLFFTNVYGYDNNYFDHVIFYKCASGLRQLATVSGVDIEPRINYMDKNVFFQCQWLSCGQALDLVALRASGGNAWVNCRFQDNSVNVAQAKNHSPMGFYNCDLINNAGSPVVNTNGSLNFIACRFFAGARNPADLVDAGSLTLEGCTFSRSGATSTVLTSGNGLWNDLRNPANLSNYTNRHVHLFNNRSIDVPVGTFSCSILINNDFPADPTLTGRLAWQRGGVVTRLDAGPATPGTRLLIGELFSVGVGSGTGGPSSSPTPTPTPTPTEETLSAPKQGGDSSGGCGLGPAGVVVATVCGLIAMTRRRRREMVADNPSLPR